MVDNKFIRFLFVGGLNTIFGYLMFALFIFLDFHYSIAVLLSTILGVLFNFKTTGRFVFGNQDNILLFKFVGVYVLIYILNTSALKVFNLYRLNMYVAGLIVLLPMAMIAFVLNKKFVFKG